MRLSIRSIRRDPDLQLRDGLDMERVETMQETLNEGGTLPPVTVVGDDNLLADGYHRVYVQERAGMTEVEAEHKPGGFPEAIAIALLNNGDQRNSALLTRDQRNAGIKFLLIAGWSLRKIAKETGVHNTTVLNIQQSLAARGVIKKEGVVALPKAVHEKLKDTTLARIAAVPAEKQVELAEAAAEAGIPEPRVREAIKTMKAHPALTPTEAVKTVTPRPYAKMPASFSGVADQVRRRLDAFLSDPMTIDKTPRDFWAVLDVLVANQSAISDLARNELVSLLEDVSAKADHYASGLKSETVLVAR